MDPAEPTRTGSDLPTVGAEEAARAARAARGLPDLPARYLLAERLGEGGFGRVYAARDHLLGRDVAVKVLQGEADESARRRHKELSALRLLDLPGVVRLLDSGKLGTESWFVMERVRGHAFPGTDGLLKWDALEPIAVELLRILARIHRAGFIHGDLKPSNVLVTAEGKPIVLDLGLAHVAEPGEGTVSHFAGTPLYMSPEMARGAPSTPQSDLYAIGLMLWRALTGEWPEDARTPDDVLAERAHGMRRTISSRLPGLPAHVGSIIDSLTEPEAEDRPQSALDVIRILSESEGAPPLEVSAESAAELEPLFAGPERLFHIPSAAARLLWSRADGSAARAAEILETWIDLGVLQRGEDGRVSVTPNDLDRLLAGWSPETDAPRPWRGAIPGTPLALGALLGESDDVEAAQAALDAYGRERHQGNLSAAAACLREGLQAIWRTEDRTLEQRLVEAAGQLALTDRSVAAIDEAMDLIGRSRVSDGAHRDLMTLLRAARMLLDGRRLEAIPILETQLAAGVGDLEHRCHDLLVEAVVNGPLDPAALEAVRDGFEAWARSQPGNAPPEVFRWRARLLYRRGRMREAAEEAQRGAARERTPYDRLLALLAAGLATLESADSEATTKIANAAFAVTSELRLPRLEARAEHLARSLANRTDSAHGPDQDLCEAAIALGAPHLEGLLLVTEAVIAWRARNPAAADLATRARTAFESAGYREAALFASALEESGNPPDRAAAARLAAAACQARRPDVAVEVLGILAQSGRLSGDWREAFEAQAAALPNVDPNWRSGALSVSEARAAILAQSDCERTHPRKGQGGEP